MEVFSSEDTRKILWKKFIVVIGDSVQRCVYKDLVCLLVPNSNTTYLTPKELKAKGELEFLGDKLLQGGQLSDVKTGVKYREVRQYDSGSTLLKFYFVTRCYSDHVMSVLNELKAIQPHVVIMNSCLWDLHRYGPCTPEDYHRNMTKLMLAVKRVLPEDSVFIWNATMPLASKCKGGFFLPFFDSIPSQEIMAANRIAGDIIRSFRFIFLDLHSIFMHQLHLRAQDGIHWNSIAHRRISNLILHQLCRMWNLPVPSRMIAGPLPLPPPLFGPRPLSRSFSVDSNLDSFYNPYELDSPTNDRRYVVERSQAEEDLASNNRNRFRLISSPIPKPITSTSTKTINNCSSFGSNEKEKSQASFYTSSPLEPCFKTPTEAPKLSSHSSGASPCLPAPRTSILGDPPSHLRIDNPNTTLSASSLTSSVSLASSSVTESLDSNVKAEPCLPGTERSDSGNTTSESEDTSSEPAALTFQTESLLSEKETSSVEDSSCSKESSIARVVSFKDIDSPNIQASSPAVEASPCFVENTVSSPVSSLDQLLQEIQDTPLPEDKSVNEDKNLVCTEYEQKLSEKSLLYDDGLSIVTSLHEDTPSVAEVKSSSPGEATALLGHPSSLLHVQPSKSSSVPDTDLSTSNRSVCDDKHLEGKIASTATVTESPLPPPETSCDTNLSVVRSTSPLIAAEPVVNSVTAYPSMAETPASAVVPLQSEVSFCERRPSTSSKIPPRKRLCDSDEDGSVKALREKALLSQQHNREHKSRKRTREDDKTTSSDVHHQSSAKRHRRDSKESEERYSSQKESQSSKCVESTVRENRKKSVVATSKSTHSKYHSLSSSREKHSKEKVKVEPKVKDSKTSRGSKRKASDSPDYNVHRKKHSKEDDKALHSRGSTSRKSSVHSTSDETNHKPKNSDGTRPTKYLKSVIAHYSTSRNNKTLSNNIDSEINNESFRDNSNHDKRSCNANKCLSHPKSQSTSHEVKNLSTFSDRSRDSSFTGGTSSHESHIDFKVPKAPESSWQHQRHVSMGGSIPVISVHNYPQCNTNWTSTSVNQTSRQYINTGLLPTSHSAGLANHTGNPAGTGRQFSTTGTPTYYTGRPYSTIASAIGYGRHVNTTGNPMCQTVRQVSTTGNPMCQTARQVSTTGNPMVQAQLAQQQMLFNMSLHRRRSYPPGNPYANSYSGYYNNQRY